MSSATYSQCVPMAAMLPKQRLRWTRSLVAEARMVWRELFGHVSFVMCDTHPPSMWSQIKQWRVDVLISTHNLTTQKVFVVRNMRQTAWRGCRELAGLTTPLAATRCGWQWRKSYTTGRKSKCDWIRRIHCLHHINSRDALFFCLHIIALVYVQHKETN